MGGGFNAHTDYQIKVVQTTTVNEAGSSNDSQHWTVYRRYSNFQDLHSKLVNVFGQSSLDQMRLSLPEKSYTGSFLATSKVIVQSRKELLQDYLNSLMVAEPLTNNILINHFLDTENKGASGLCRQFGSAKIMKETFAKTCIFKSIEGLGWLRYVVLLRDGKLAVLRSKYDDMKDAQLLFDLTQGQIIMKPQSDRNGVLLISKSTKKLSISFDSNAESAFWIRTLADFCSTLDMPEKMRPPKIKTQTNVTTTNNSSQSNSPVEEYRAAGTGNTEDDLSTQLGI